MAKIWPSLKDKLAWLIGLRVGENKKAGDWSAFVDYRQVGIGSIDPNVNSDNFAESNLNVQGFRFTVAYNLTDFAVLGGSGSHGAPGSSASSSGSNGGHSPSQGYSAGANSAGSSTHGGNSHGVASHGAFGGHGIFGGLFGGHQSHSSSKGVSLALRGHTVPAAVPAVHQAATKRTDPPAHQTDPPAQVTQNVLANQGASDTGAVHHRLRSSKTSQNQLTQR